VSRPGVLWRAFELADSSGLKGRDIVAQGRAQRRPGKAAPKMTKPCKGVTSPGVRSIAGRDMSRPCRAHDFSITCIPRALPWAIMSTRLQRSEQLLRRISP
jgi:hypothetical protein